MNLEREKKNFKNHVATLTDHGNIKILDFANPNSSDYRIRFLFEEDYCTLHISGDLGSLTAQNYNNMCYEKFRQFLRSPEYFKEKILCHSRPLYKFVEAAAIDELTKRIIDNNWIHAVDDAEFESKLEALLDEVFLEFDSMTGIGPYGISALDDYDIDASEWADNLGKKSSGIVELYLLAFELAMAQIEK